MRDVAVPTFLRYSSAFKYQVISEIESGHLSIVQAQRKYDIRGASTIQNWLRQMGKNNLLPKVIRVEKPQERDEKKELQKRIRELESALADAHIKNLLYESLIEVADEHYGTDLKKNFGTKLSAKRKESRKEAATESD